MDKGTAQRITERVLAAYERLVQAQSDPYEAHLLESIHFLNDAVFDVTLDLHGSLLWRIWKEHPELEPKNTHTPFDPDKHGLSAKHVQVLLDTLQELRNAVVYARDQEGFLDHEEGFRQLLSKIDSARTAVPLLQRKAGSAPE